VITEAGLQLLLDSGTSPQAGQLHEPLRLERDRLVQAGLLDGDGRLNPAAEEVVKAIRRPNVQPQIEVAAGQSVRAWKAWLGYSEPSSWPSQARPSPRPDGPQDIAERTPLALADYQLQVVASPRRGAQLNLDKRAFAGDHQPAGENPR
jgi:hypothetical protein